MPKRHQDESKRTKRAQAGPRSNFKYLFKQFVVPFWGRCWLHFFIYIYIYIFLYIYSESFLTSLLGGIFNVLGGHFGDFSELGGALEGKKWLFWKHQIPLVKPYVWRVRGSPRRLKTAHFSVFFKFFFGVRFRSVFHEILSSFWAPFRLLFDVVFRPRFLDAFGL